MNTTDRKVIRQSFLRPSVGVFAALMFLVLGSIPPVPSQSAPPEPQTPAAQKPRLKDYLAARRKARAWFDRLDVDPVDLLKHRVKGKKKVAEILGVYMNFLRHTNDPKQTAAIMVRVSDVSTHTQRPEYHNMDQCSDKEFVQNSMSYFRVMWLMREFGLDTTYYRAEVLKVKERMDAHMARRGPWQRAMFGDYYDMFGIEKPDLLNNVQMKEGVIARRLPADNYDQPYTDPKTGRVRTRSQNSYDLTHEVFVAYNYGLDKTQTRFARDDLEYTRQVLPVLVIRYINESNPDLLAEMLSCMTYLGWHDDPTYQVAINYLLDVQNPDGTWGDYEKWRPSFGQYLDQHLYLHTTMVAMRALMEGYQGNWPAAD